MSFKYYIAKTNNGLYVIIIEEPEGSHNFQILFVNLSEEYAKELINTMSKENGERDIK